MHTNSFPRYDNSVNTTGCCPKFNPAGWDSQALHFEDKDFVRATTRSLLHVPLDMSRVFTRVQQSIEHANANDSDNCVVLSRDLSASHAEHLFSVSAPVQEEEMTSLSGDFVTRVFEGPYRKIGTWEKEMRGLVELKGGTPSDVYFFYTTCPKCAKAYGKNYVIGVARV
jgi:hypothetical protein